MPGSQYHRALYNVFSSHELSMVLLTRPLFGTLIALLILLGLSACSTKPKLLPNDHLIKVGKLQSEADVQECLDLADSYASDSKRWQEVAGETAKSAVIGSAAGAVGGAIVHNAGRGVAVGAATAAVATLLYELTSLGESDPTYKRFVEFCLDKKGYDVAGWR